MLNYRSTNSNIHPLRLILTLGVLLSFTSVSFAQLPSLTLTSTTPNGAKAGTEIELTVAGGNMDELRGLVFSHPGITAKQKTRDPQPYESGPQPVDKQFIVTVKADVPAGIYDVRALGLFGISNPRAFAVGTLEEVAETAATKDKFDTAQEIVLNSVVSGAIKAKAEQDIYKVKLKANQKQVIDLKASQIDSALDASLIVYDVNGRELVQSRDVNQKDPLVVFTAPHDGEFFVKVFDFTYQGGTAHFYRLSVSSIPQIDLIFPPSGVAGSNGKYTLYGRNLPGGQPVNDATVDRQPLEKVEVNIAIPADFASRPKLIPGSYSSPEATMIDVIPYSFQNSNTVPLGVATNPVVAEIEPNNTPKEATKVKIPCEFVGQFNPRSDNDWLEFEAKKNEVYWIETISQRMGTKADPFVLIQRVDKQEDGSEKVSDIQVLDDGIPWEKSSDKKTSIGGAAFNLKSDDVAWQFKVPADSTYRILIRDLYFGSRGDPRLVYRLSIRKSQPDFRLIALGVGEAKANDKNTPAVLGNPCVRQGGTVAFRVAAARLDGLNEPIELRAEGLPAGVTCQPVTIGPGATSGTLIVQAAENAAQWAGSINIIGKTKVDGKDVQRIAQSGVLVSQGGNNQPPASSRQARDIRLAVIDAEQDYFALTAGDGKPLEMARGGKLEIPVKVLRRGEFKGDVAVVAAGLPANATGKNISIKKDKTDEKFIVELKSNSPVGVFSVYLTGSSQVPYQRNPKAIETAKKQKELIDKYFAELKKQEQAAQKENQDITKVAADLTNKVKAANQKLAQAKSSFEKQKDKPELKQAFDAAQKAHDDLAKNLADSNQKKAESDKKYKELQAKVKAFDATQKAAAKKVTDTTAAAKAKNTNVVRPSVPFTIKVTPAPFTINPIANIGTVKQGEKLNVKVAVNRLYDYKDAIQIDTKPAASLKNVTGKKVNIDKDKNEATVEFTAAKNATAGTHTVKFTLTAKFNNQNVTHELEAPITIEAVEAKK